MPDMIAESRSKALFAKYGEERQAAEKQILPDKGSF
jgi:hypothetical protein